MTTAQEKLGHLEYYLNVLPPRNHDGVHSNTSNRVDLKNYILLSTSVHETLSFPNANLSNITKPMSWVCAGSAAVKL